MRPIERAALGLKLVPGLGDQLIRQLLVLPGSESIFSWPVNRLQQIEDIGPVRARAIAGFSAWDAVERAFENGVRAGAQLLVLTDGAYPLLLRQIFDPPPVLWVLGDAAALSKPGIAVVGTRSPTPYGKRLVDAFVPALVEQGLTVYSGLAYGIDTLAHRKTLECGGTTVAVLGSGIDRIYPASNVKLAREVAASGGAVITECMPGAAPDAGNFPARNRIVSGLSRGVFVVESGEEGGSMITARVALDQSRDVFAAPHPVESLKGTGCNQLIRDSLAKLVITPADIFSELNLKRVPLQQPAPVNPAPPSARPGAERLTSAQQRILQLLDNGDRHIDDLTVETARDLRDVSVDLFELEMEGWVRQLPGKRFIRA